MMRFSDYKKSLKKCSQCGLCMFVCPLYKESKNDCENARGICMMLNGIIKGDLEFDYTVLKYIEKCLEHENCDLCKSFCPSGIDLPAVFKFARDTYKK